MKIIHILIVNAVAAMSVMGAIPSELEKLEKERVGEIAEVNSNYVKQLEKLKLKYMKKGDLDSANMVQSKIDSISTPNQKPQKDQLEDSRWAWGSGGTLTLQKNGVARHTSWGHRSGKWKKYNDGTMTITVGSSVFKVTFIDDVQGQVIHKKTGAKTTITRKK